MKTIKFLLAAIIVAIGGNAYAAKLTANKAKSEITWYGSKVTGEHNGLITLKSGELEMDGETVKGGKFVVDMTSIVNLDIESEEHNKKLVGHLKSDDFFSVDTYPEATLVIKNNATFKDGKATVNGDLTVKGITHPITFDVTKDGDVFETEVSIDRSKFDVKYGSGSFFDDLGDRLIHDDFILGITIVTE